VKAAPNGLAYLPMQTARDASGDALPMRRQRTLMPRALRSIVPVARARVEIGIASELKLGPRANAAAHDVIQDRAMIGTAGLAVVTIRPTSSDRDPRSLIGSSRSTTSRTVLGGSRMGSRAR